MALNESVAYGDIVGELEAIYRDEAGMRRRFNAMKSVRKYFLYNFAGTEPDAVTLALVGIQQKLAKT